MSFTINGAIEDIEVISRGRGIRDLDRIQKQFGIGKWRKLKGAASVTLPNGSTRLAEVHWYEASNIGKKKFKIKKFIK